MFILTPEERRNSLIMKGVSKHHEESLKYFSEEQIVGIFLQGSQNYNLDYEGSDIDTKLIVVPNFRDVCLNKKPVSTTHVCKNEEHIDFKDVRLYMETFRKQNLNFLEILFTPFFILNPLYKEEWERLVEAREIIARMNVYRAVKSMKGIAMEKYHAMEHKYPTRMEYIEKWGYDPKQLHHLLRIEEYIGRYINGEAYEECLRPHYPEYLVDVKRGRYNLEEARLIGKTAIENIVRVADIFCSTHQDFEETWVRELLEDVSYNIMKTSVEKELKLL